jgi:NADH:ubiquinone oxidoreductase subunit 3 (subunit A)
MEWYWWVLIAVVLVAGATIKLKVLGKWLANRKKNEVQYSDDE